LDAAPQAGVDHRYRDLSGLRGKLRVIACTEDPLLIVKILGYVQRREAAAIMQARAPPTGSQQTLILT